MKVVAVLFLILFTLQVSADLADLQFIREAAEGTTTTTQDAINKLKDRVVNEKDKDRKSLLTFGLGVLAFRISAYTDAQNYFKESLKLKGRLEDYAEFYLAKSLAASQGFNEAKEYFHKVLNYQPRTQLYSDARFELAQIAMEQQRWSEALDHLTFLERRMRRDPKYPLIIWSMLKSELRLARRYKACRWAEKLYSQQSTHPLVRGWSIDLQKVEFEGVPLGCFASPNLQKARVRNLQLNGETEKAKNEIAALRSRTNEDSVYHVDYMLANLLANDGQIEESLKILQKYSLKMGGDFSYLMLLAKVAGRAGEFETSVGAYYKAYKMRSSHKLGKSALFQAAFLSYQFQDYDGAARKFEEFVQKYGRSGLSQDAKWHLSWIRYLKADYVGAAKSFQQLYSMSGRGRAKISDKVRYWTAMSLFRQGRILESKPIFESLAANKLYGYYTLLAKSRLEQMKKSFFEKQLAQIKPAPEEPLIMPSYAYSIDWNFAKGNGEDEGESEETIAAMMSATDQGTDEVATEEVAEEDSAAATPAEETLIDEPRATSFRDPALIKRFERGSDLIELGFKDWAQQELYEIERRTSNRTFLKTLMQEYQRAGNYNRASYLGQVTFGGERSRFGIEGALNTWQFAFPQAYRSSVLHWSKTFSIPDELVWGIMRAESQYRPEVRSPVGALGLLQLMPNTANQMARLTKFEGFDPIQLTQPEVNIHVGASYLQRLSKKFNGKVPLVAASYNAGPHRVESWVKSFGKLDMDEFIEHIPFLETRNYAKNVVTNVCTYKQLYTIKDPRKWDINWLAEPVGIEIKGDAATRETWDEI